MIVHIAKNSMKTKQKSKTHATAFIVFGATGDLTQNKLYPALYDLSRRNLLPKTFFLYGIAREKMSQKQFVNDIRKDFKFHLGKKIETKVVERLLRHVRYIPADLSDQAGYLELEDQIQKEEKRQLETIDLIASENYASPAVREASGSVLTNKYSEGYAGARYYPGNEFVDEMEILKQKYGINSVHFLDNDFIYNKDRVLHL